MELLLSEQKTHPIPKMLTGIFFEDINYAADGGLCAEMIENPGFEFYCLHNSGPQDFWAELDTMYGWAPCPVAGVPGMKVVTGSPLNQANPHHLRVFAQKDGQGVANKAFDGVCCREGQRYKVSLYTRNVSSNGVLQISVEKLGRFVRKY